MSARRSHVSCALRNSGTRRARPRTASVIGEARRSNLARGVHVDPGWLADMSSDPILFAVRADGRLLCDPIAVPGGMPVVLKVYESLWDALEADPA